jgi:hypothetical protein
MGNILYYMRNTKSLNKKLTNYDKPCIDAASKNIDDRKLFMPENKSKFSTEYSYKKEQLRLLEVFDCEEIKDINKSFYEKYYKPIIKANPTKYINWSIHNKLSQDEYEPFSKEEIQDILANPERYKQMLKKKYGTYWQYYIKDMFPEFYIERYVDDAPPGIIEVIKGGKSRKHKKYKKRTKKYKRV